MRKMTGMALLVLVLLLITQTVSAQTMYVKTNGGHLNLRDQPFMEGEVLARLPYGQKVELLGYVDSNWAEINVKWNGTTLDGYVDKHYLSSRKPADSGSDDPSYDGEGLSLLNQNYRAMNPVSPYTAYVRPSRAGGFVNLRWGPSKGTEVIERLYADHMLVIYALGRDWAQVCDPETGYYGYIMQSFLATY